MNGLRPLGAVFCVLTAGATTLAPLPASAAPERDALQVAAPGGTIALEEIGGDYRVSLPSGAAVRSPAVARALPTAIAAVADGWVLAGSRTVDDGGRRLFLHRGGDPSLDTAAGAEVRSLPVPSGRWGSVRRDPVLFVEGDGLAGMAWLEGSGDGDRLAVRAAAWDGRGWSAPETVSPLGRGGQLALSAAVLGDGSWLLVWTATDETDDETVWSRRLAGAWGAPQRVSVDNEIPDITPALTVLEGGGALVAWSRYDGRSYRLRTARFEPAVGEGGEGAGVWVDDRWAAASGSLYPSFVGSPDRPVLLYRDAAASGWATATLDRRGAALRVDRAPDSPAARPVVDRAGARSVLRWRASGRTALTRPVADQPVAEEGAP